jgi:hypothetical protein
VSGNPGNAGFSKWSTPLSVIGSVIVAAATFSHYANAHRQEKPGGYLAIVLGAFFVGLLVTIGSYFNRPKPVRSRISAILSGGCASIVFVSVFLVTLVWSFGS